jgi:hypothetical protein
MVGRPKGAKCYSILIRAVPFKGSEATLNHSTFEAAHLKLKNFHSTDLGMRMDVWTPKLFKFVSIKTLRIRF